MVNTQATQTLERLYDQHEGKLTDKWSLYLSEYNRLFAPYRERPIRLLEIGIQNGGSLEVWTKFFRRAQKLVGCDINPKCSSLHYDDPRVAVVVADANTDEAEQQILTHSTRFDLIIDDGSHDSSDIIRSFARYFPHLECGGLYVVEDLHCSYWKPFTGGLFHPYSSMTFLKQLADVINFEHWGIDKTRSEFLQSFERVYGSNFPEDLLAEIHSVQFVNSICSITKKSAPDNSLGTRVVHGTLELVESGVHAVHGMPPYKTDQRANEYSICDAKIEETVTCGVALEDNADIRRLQEELAARDQLIQSLQSQIAALQCEVSSLGNKL